MIICGDDAQVDLKQKRDSGFKFLYSASKKIKKLEAISLKQNHRDPIVEDLINLYNDAYEKGMSLGSSGTTGNFKK
jgi:phosphate starvation-inducible protein PhoH